MDTREMEELTAVRVARGDFPAEQPIVRRRTLFARHCGQRMLRIAFKRCRCKRHCPNTEGPYVDSILVCVNPDCRTRWREPRIGY